MIRAAWRWIRALTYRPEHRGYEWATATYAADVLYGAPVIAPAIDTGQMRAIEPARSFALGELQVYDADDWREDWTDAELAELRDGLEADEDWAVATIEAEDFAPVLGEQWLHAHWWWYGLEAAREADEYHNLIAAERLAFRREMGLPIDLERVAA